MPSRRPRVLAISSGGGHWVELRRLAPAFADCDVTWCATHPDYRNELISDAVGSAQAPEFFHVMEAIRWQKFRMLRQVFDVIWVLIRVRPDVVISTGASPGFFGILFGKTVLRSKTIWVQSIADTEGMSMSGNLVRRYADLWLTQWEHLAKPEGPHYHGSVV